MNPSAPGGPSEPRSTPNASAEDTFQVPPIAKDDDGPDVTAQPGAEVGHYGMGYGDPTRHQGGNWPGEGTSLPRGPRPADPMGGTARSEGKAGGQQ